MASKKLFDSVPQFPDDVPTARMVTVPLSGLCSGDRASCKTLVEACRTLGFFLLDLQGDPLGEVLMSEVDEMFRVGKRLLELPADEKARFKHDPPKSFLGFKPRGVARTEKDEPDRFEWFNLGQDGLLGNSTLQELPQFALDELPLFKSFLLHGQSIVSLINRAISVELGLPPDTLASLQPLDKASGTSVRIIKAYASTGDRDSRTNMIHHTDFGTITLLANVLGGLQILTPGGDVMDEDAWRYVRPQPGCLIANLGDAMVQWTGGMLRSNMHRIRFAPGQQRFLDRYSVAIVVRPNRDASMRSLVGPSDVGQDDGLTAWEWEVKQMMALAHKRSA